MENVPTPADELAVIDRELRQLDARRGQLLARRTWLLAAMRPPAASAAPPFPPPGTWPAGQRPQAEASAPSVQNVLLALGGILLAVAAIAFTLVSWGHMGIGGRAAVLGAVTLAALATPVALLRRGLVATAESVGVVGLVLLVLDAYALHRVAVADTGGLAYTAGASAALAGLWSVYGLALPRLRTPLPAAVVAAQLPLPLWALAGGAAAPSMEWALLLTAVLDVVSAVWIRPVVVRRFAGVAASVTGGLAALTGLWQSLAAGSPAGAAEPALLLLTAAAVALFAAWRSPAAAVAASVAAGLAAVAAVGGVIRTTVPQGWAALGYLLCATALLAAVRASLPGRVVRGLAWASVAVQVAAAVSALPVVLVSLAGPVTRLTDIWSAAPSGAREALDLDIPLPTLAATPLVLAVLAATAALVSRRLPAGSDGIGMRTVPGRATPGPEHADAGPPPAAAGAPVPLRTWVGPAAACGSLVLAWTALLVLPVVLDLPYHFAVGWQLVLAVLLSLLGAVRTAPGALRYAPFAYTAVACGLAASVSVALLSLATRPATLAVLGALPALLTAAAFRARGPVQQVLASAATVFVTGFAGAAAAAAGLPQHRTALVLLLVPAAAAAAGARLRRHPVALPVEAVSAAAGLVAVALAAGHAPTLAMVLALCGVITAGTAVRPERRPSAGYVAAVLFVLATWVRLFASDVTSPEAYTLPVTVPALLIGALRRRRDPQASSWTAYGPGLAATLVPSLFAAWGDEHWLRPLLLGLAALVVTLAGARLRLQALLVLGGTVLTLDTLHELAPYVVQAVGALPRWLPPAAAGLLLLAVGATYEQRLRDARRLKETLGRMH
ncbi:SCO7613 C-terminal domain-containing membrane protein [Streptomyces sp. NPDC018833]|uniref:SCO7613 C-terminal domain-containing membrane protein n=1 Tax=Streptomyces sp. NPDC018833 TaxID=3365053 RepID=UPI0037B8DCFC